LTIDIIVVSEHKVPLLAANKNVEFTEDAETDHATILPGRAISRVTVGRPEIEIDVSSVDDLELTQSPKGMWIGFDSVKERFNAGGSD
jgi:hypothetical protein